MTPHIVNEQNAAKILEWLRSRGGILIWPSVNLSNPGASWTTPLRDEHGARYMKPTWQAADKPERLITDPAEVVVSRDIEVKRFYVAVRPGGMGLKVTDGGTRRIRSAVAKAGAGAYHVFDHSTQEAVILKPAEQVSLVEWEQRGVPVQ